MTASSVASSGMRRARFALLLAVLLSPAAFAAQRPSPDHHEFEATLEAPWTGVAGDAREFVLRFAFPDAADPNTVAWRLRVLAPDGTVLRSWHGEERLYGMPIEVTVPWDGRGRAKAPLADGHYRAELTASAGDPVAFATTRGTLEQRVDAVLARGGAQVQAWDVEVGKPQRPQMPAFEPLPVGAEQAKSRPATAGLPYTVYYGNLHSQTNDSDGGGAIPGCSGSQAAQSGAFGPNDAFVYAKNRGLDFLLASEHNHYFDGSSGTNASANPTTAKNRYAAGRSAAASFNTANPTFLALYGMEWGVISGGGHLNIIDANLLANWEYNSSSQLIADIFTTKSDYAALYDTMKARGWIGQFNHPSASDAQFPIAGTTFGYDPDGDEVMVAVEVQNTSAFSTNTTETETSRSSYESAYNTFLERGFHVAPTTNQDNHCANWGASWTNRTAVLLPSGQALTEANFEAALRARRVFATSDKNSQLILTANGRVMGERFVNSGPLTLTANFANTAGRTAATVRIYEGVPRRNGTVTQLSTTAVTTITPSNGEHFYYAKITQDDGKILWSAPVWVTQTAGGDTTPPTVTASESGTSGTITLAATASDNVGVSNVEFLIDGVLRGSDATSPYSIAFDSTSLANGSHSLTARAYDAAGNNATSSPVSFSISNGSTPVERIANGGYESGATSWTATSGVITNGTGQPARTGSWKAWLNGYGSAHTDTLYQSVAIPSTVTTATLRFWLLVDSDETTTTQAFDTLKVQVRSSSNAVLATLATYSNLNKGTSYVQRTFDVSAYKGQTIRVYFEGIEGSQVQTSFVVDDASLQTQ
jgi:hypothetical protein